MVRFKQLLYCLNLKKKKLQFWGHELDYTQVAVTRVSINDRDLQNSSHLKLATSFLEAEKAFHQFCFSFLFFFFFLSAIVSAILCKQTLHAGISC